MVQHSFQLFFLSLFAASLVSLFAVSLGQPVKRTVETDIATMSAQITRLDSVVDKLSAVGIVSLTSALAVHSAAVALGTTVDSATNDVTAGGPVDEDDGNDILNSIQGFVPNIQDILTKLSNGTAITAIGKLPGFTAIALSDMKRLNNSAIAFTDALIANLPADLVPAGMSLRNKISTAFASTIAIYNNLA